MAVDIVKILNPTIFQIVGGLNYKGTYSGGTSYGIGDVVAYNGSSYVATAIGSGNVPTDISFWQLIALKGDTGGIGPTAWGDIIGTITDQADLQNFVDSGITHAKNLTNNAATDLFSFPLTVGEFIAFFFQMNLLVTKASDWAAQMYMIEAGFYNNGGVLVPTSQSIIAGDNATSGGAVSGGTPNANSSFTGSLSTGVVTIAWNPGNVGTSPDSIVLNYRCDSLPGKTRTYL